MARFKAKFTIFALLSLLLPSCAEISFEVAYEGIKAITKGDDEGRSSEYHIKRAMKLESTHPNEAIKEYKKAMDKDTSDYRPYFGIANIQHKFRDYVRAEDYYIKASERVSQKHKPIVYNNFAWLYLETNRPVMAEHLMFEAEVEFQDFERSHIYNDTRGTIYTRIGNIPLAKDYYRKAVIEAPFNDIQFQRALYSHIRDMYLREGDTLMTAKLDNILKKLEMGMPVTVNDLAPEGLR